MLCNICNERVRVLLKVRIDLCLYLVGKRVENTCVSHVKPRWVGRINLVMIVDVSNLKLKPKAFSFGPSIE